ncbi:MAG: limonene-1,2-epoxide hydrolase family protein [Acidimicrobiia bacterium]
MGVEQEQVVLAFLECTNRRRIDVGGMVALLSDNVSYQVFVPSTPRVGREAARAELERQDAMATGLLPGSEVRHIASNDRVVFVERVEVTETTGIPLTLQINGVFEVDDGEIVAWRDYYDTADVAAQLGIDVKDIVATIG